MPEPPPEMVEKRLMANEILQKANNLKNNFSANKGRADQIISDSLSDTVQGLMGMIQNLLKERAMDDARIKSLEQQVAELTKKQPKKKIPEPEKPDEK